MLPLRLAVFAAALVAALLWPGRASALVCPGSTVCNQNPGTATVLRYPKVYVVWWGWGTPANDPSGLQPVLRTFLRNLGGTQYLNTVRQYYSFEGRCGNPVALWGGEISDNTNPLPSGYPTDAQFDAEAAWAITQLNPVEDGILFIALPASNPFPAGTCGQHRSVVRSGMRRLAIVEFPYQANGVTNCYGGSPSAAASTAAVAMHELVEAITDPRYDDPSGNQLAWVDTAGLEVSDKCAAVRQVGLTNATNFFVSDHWSNAANYLAGACVFAHSSRHNLFYNASDSTLRRLPLEEYAPGTVWEDWGKPSGLNLTSSPGVASWGPNREDAFAYDSSGNLSHWYWTYPASAGWNSWGKPAGYTFLFSPDAATWKPFRIDVIATAQLGTIIKVFHRYWDNGFFSAWQDWGAPPGVVISSRASIASWGPSRFDMFVLGSDNAIWHAWSTDGTSVAGWNSWGSPAGVSLSDPDAASWGLGRIDVFAKGSDGNLWRRYYDNGTYPAWENLGKPSGGSIVSGPGAIGAGDGRWYAAAKGPGNTAWEKSFFFLSPWADRGGAPVTRLDASSW